MIHTASLRLLVLLSLAAIGIAGCHWGDRYAKVEELSFIQGISVLEFDGVFLHVKRDLSSTAGLGLIVAGRFVDEAKLRMGNRFVLTNGRDVHETYQVLLIDQERITLKRQEVFDRRASREGIRAIETAVAVTPYNREEDD